MTAKKQTFQALVFRGAKKYGISLEWEPAPTHTTLIGRVSLRFWRPGTPVRVMSIFGVTDSSCLSENGSPMCAADVVQRLRAKLESRRT